MRKMPLLFVTLMFVSQFSLAFAAEPTIRQVQPRHMAPQRGKTIPQLQLTPEYLYQQITALQQQVAQLQGQVNLLRSVVQITQNGTMIQAENLYLNAVQKLTMSSGKETQLTVGDDLSLTSGKNLLVKGGQFTTIEGQGRVNLKSPQIKMNDGNKSLAVVGSQVSSGKVITGSNSVFAQ